MIIKDDEMTLSQIKNLNSFTADLKKAVEQEINTLHNGLEKKILEQVHRLEEISAKLKESKAMLEEEISEHQKTKEEINKLNEELKSKVLKHTIRLQEMNVILEEKKSENIRVKNELDYEVMRNNIINTIIKTLHEKNPREEQHSKRVSEMCQNIGKALDFSEVEVSQLKTVGLLHDIGKIAIEDAILNKPGKLTEQELVEIKRHPDIGYRILSSSYDMIELADCILAHHERWDGTGYPKGLKGENIPRVARIIALADSYDAMTSERPYRKALNEEEAFMEIRKNSGTQFDPEITRIFVEKVLGRSWD